MRFVMLLGMVLLGSSVQAQSCDPLQENAGEDALRQQLSEQRQHVVFHALADHRGAHAQLTRAYLLQAGAIRQLCVDGRGKPLDAPLQRARATELARQAAMAADADPLVLISVAGESFVLSAAERAALLAPRG
jgi:hypothetical protein